MKTTINDVLSKHDNNEEITSKDFVDIEVVKQAIEFDSKYELNKNTLVFNAIINLKNRYFSVEILEDTNTNKITVNDQVMVELERNTNNIVSYLLDTWRVKK